MKKLLSQVAPLALICTSCLFLFGESFAYRDSITNATKNYCSVTSKLYLALTTEQLREHSPFMRNAEKKSPLAPETRCGFSSIGRSLPLPLLTNIVVETWTRPPQMYSLNADQLLRLRNAAGGEVHLILYEEGLACEPPSYRRELAEARNHVPFDKSAYYHFLRRIKDPALAWTREVLGPP